jgi:hypothetical protein
MLHFVERLFRESNRFGLDARQIGGWNSQRHHQQNRDDER